ncbi:hypothetical protein GCM10029992_51580 [Glycomyces albus]
MRTRRSGRLALVTGVGADNHMRMLGGAGEAAAEAGYAMETHCLEGTAEDRTARLLELAAGRQFEGILAFIPVVPEALATASASTPVVTATAFDDQMHSVGDLADASLIDDFITALAEAGYRRFVHLAGSDKWASARSRQAVYLAAVERLGVESLGVLGGDWPAETGRRAALSLPEGTPRSRSSRPTTSSPPESSAEPPSGAGRSPGTWSSPAGTTTSSAATPRRH